jgi:hypothetical protein
MMNWSIENKSENAALIRSFSDENATLILKTQL